MGQSAVQISIPLIDASLCSKHKSQTSKTTVLRKIEPPSFAPGKNHQNDSVVLSFEQCELIPKRNTTLHKTKHLMGDHHEGPCPVAPGQYLFTPPPTCVNHVDQGGLWATSMLSPPFLLLGDQQSPPWLEPTQVQGGDFPSVMPGPWFCNLSILGQKEK